MVWVVMVVCVCVGGGGGTFQCATIFDEFLDHKLRQILEICLLKILV